MRIVISTVIFLYLLSCSTPANNEETQTGSEISKQDIAPDPVQETIPVTSNLSDTDVRIINKLLKSIEKFEIALPIEIYDAYYNSRTEYLEYINKEIQPEVGIDSVRVELDKNLTEVIKRTRKFVMEDYQKFNSIEGRLFSFLYMVRDSSANEFLELIYNNKNADSAEVERLKSTYPKL